MKTTLTIFTAIILCTLAGCQPRAGEKELLKGKKELLTVDFQKSHTLRYKFVCQRDVRIVWSPTKGAAKSGKNKVDKSSEVMDMVVAYTPIEVDPYGLTTIKATCKSVKVRRTSHTGQRVSKKDAVENLTGKTFTFTVEPTGKIEDYSQLEKLIREIGKKAFRPSRKKEGRIKEPDMIDDFIGTQWFLWDSVSSIEKAVEGVSVGQSWKSKLSVPNPMLLRKARDVTYTLDEIRQTEKGRLAVIRSSYSLAKSVPRNWPRPYSGRFQLAGRFGFLTMLFKGYKAVDLHGQGKELFNIDKGRIENYNQQYQMRLVASSPGALGLNPQITIKQKLTMKLLE